MSPAPATNAYVKVLPAVSVALNVPTDVPIELSSKTEVDDNAISVGTTLTLFMVIVVVVVLLRVSVSSRTIVIVLAVSEVAVVSKVIAFNAVSNCATVGVCPLAAEMVTSSATVVSTSNNVVLTALASRTSPATAFVRVMVAESMSVES